MKGQAKDIMRNEEINDIPQVEIWMVSLTKFVEVLYNSLVMKLYAATAALRYWVFFVAAYSLALTVMNKPVVIALTASSPALFVQKTPPTVDWPEQVEGHPKDLPLPDVPVIW